MTTTAESRIYQIEPLRGSDNYAVWKIRMTHILTDLGYYDHIISDPPSDSTQRAGWTIKDRKALSTIVLRVADPVIVYVSSATTAKEAWTALSEMYEAKGAIGITLTRRKLHRTICADDADIEDHIRQMRSMQAELLRLGHAIADDEFAYTLLESLPEAWDQFVSAIGDDIAKDSHKLIARILAEDSRRKARQPSQDPTAALPAFDRSKPRKGPKCYQCGGVGHIARDHTSADDDDDSSSQGEYSDTDNNHHSRRSRANLAFDDDVDFSFITHENTPPTLSHHRRRRRRPP